MRFGLKFSCKDSDLRFSLRFRSSKDFHSNHILIPKFAKGYFGSYPYEREDNDSCETPAPFEHRSNAHSNTSWSCTE